MKMLEDEEMIRVRFTKSVKEIADTAVDLFSHEPNAQPGNDQANNQSKP